MDPIFAMEKMAKDWPDVILLDVEMPRMDGITFLKKIMSERPTPVIICSSLTAKGAETTVQALAAGAFAIFTKPSMGVKNYLEDASQDLVAAVLAAAGARMSSLPAPRTAMGTHPKLTADAVLAPASPGSEAMAVTTDTFTAVGTSTGGTQALEYVLAALPRTCPGLVVVQHMPEFFTAAFAARLNDICEIEVREARTGDRVLPGRALIAPRGQASRGQAQRSPVPGGGRQRAPRQPPLPLRGCALPLRRQVRRPERHGRDHDRHGRRRRPGAPGDEAGRRPHHRPGRGLLRRLRHAEGGDQARSGRPDRSAATDSGADLAMTDSLPPGAQPVPGDILSGLDVLVVEDSAVQRGHAVDLAKELGAARILEASDGVEGLGVLAENDGVDLVISDLEMPRMEGVTFIGELAARGYRPRVLIVSALAPEVMRAVRLMAETYGLAVPGVIPKPLTLDSLRQVLTARKLPGKPGSASAASQEALSDHEIRLGIEAQEFCCFFQPQVTLQGAVFHGVEALVRWRHGQFGLLGPAAFLPQAEAQEGLMSDLTMAILEDVAMAWKDWKRHGLGVDVSVNLSAASLGVPSFSDRVLEATERLELPSRSLVFEVTESASTTRLGPFLANLAKLRMKGFRLSIDDFGTGFATFEQLERIPFTELKIDQSITYLLPQEERQMHMARRLIQMAQDLKLAVVAEGIETLENWQALRKLGCELGQGYFIARPMPGDQIAGWAKQDRSFLRG